MNITTKIFTLTVSGAAIFGFSGVENALAATRKPTHTPKLRRDVTSRPLVIQDDSFQIAQSLAGKASWYGPKFHGRRTASGEVFNSNAMTAAHRSLPFGTRVRVINVKNGRSVVVRINDRGPFIRGRIIDVSAGAARSLGMINRGVANVRIEVLGK